MDDYDDDDETFRTSPAARGESQTKETQLDTSDPESILGKEQAVYNVGVSAPEHNWAPHGQRLSAHITPNTKGKKTGINWETNTSHFVGRLLPIFPQGVVSDSGSGKRTYPLPHRPSPPGTISTSMSSVHRNLHITATTSVCVCHQFARAHPSRFTRSAHTSNQPFLRFSQSIISSNLERQISLFCATFTHSPPRHWSTSCSHLHTLNRRP